MSEFKSLEEITGYLCNVAEFELNKHDIIPIHDGHLTVVSNNYEDMYRVIEWIEDKIKQPQLNENQKALVIWMQENECYTGDPLESISDLFLEATPSEHFPNLPLSCVAAAYQSLTNRQKAKMVSEYLRQYLEQEELND